jgi:hypothetical protein
MQRRDHGLRSMFGMSLSSVASKASASRTPAARNISCTGGHMVRLLGELRVNDVRTVPNVVEIVAIMRETCLLPTLSKGKTMRCSRCVAQITMRSKCMTTRVECRTTENRRSTSGDWSSDLLGSVRRMREGAKGRNGKYLVRTLLAMSVWSLGSY